MTVPVVTRFAMISTLASVAVALSIIANVPPRTVIAPRSATSAVAVVPFVVVSETLSFARAVPIIACVALSVMLLGSLP